MGSSCHFFVGDAATAADDALALRAAPEDCASFAGLTPLELSTLWAVMESAEWDMAMMRLFPSAVAFNVDDRSVHEIPAVMIERLAALSLGEMARVAQGWAETLEMAPRAAEVSTIIVELVRLATRARTTNRRLFLVHCRERR